jgi:hypothetical protein
MAGAQVGKQGGGGHRVLVVGGRADPHLVCRVIEEEIHSKTRALINRLRVK